MAIGQTLGILDQLLVNLKSNGFDLQMYDSDLVQFGTAQDATIAYDGTDLVIVTDAASGGKLRVHATNDGGDTGVIIGNLAGTGSTDETTSLAFQTASLPAGKIVSARVSAYGTSSARDSRLDFYATLDGGDVSDVSVLPTGLGIGTVTVPHAAIGMATMAVEGADASTDGPHVQLTTAGDDHPLLQFMGWTHDNTGIFFDAYFNGTNSISGDAGSNFKIHKVANELRFAADDTITAGSSISWVTFFKLTTTELVLGVDLNAGAEVIYFTEATIVYNVTTTTANWATGGHKQRMTFGTGLIGTFAFTNPPGPCNLVLVVKQDGTGGRVVTGWDTDVLWAGGTAPTLSTGANAVDVLCFYFDGSKYHGAVAVANSS